MHKSHQIIRVMNKLSAMMILLSLIFKVLIDDAKIVNIRG